MHLRPTSKLGYLSLKPASLCRTARMENQSSGRTCVGGGGGGVISGCDMSDSVGRLGVIFHCHWDTRPDSQAPRSKRSRPDNQAPGSKRSRPDSQAPGSKRSRPDSQAPGSKRSRPDSQAPGSKRSRPDSQAPGSKRSGQNNRSKFHTIEPPTASASTESVIIGQWVAGF